MTIKKLTIEKLYGHIDKKIDFNNDLTILVGINGSGKTSILNILNWVIAPSLPDLCVTEFDKIILDFNFENKNYQVVCRHIKGIFTYKVKVDSKSFHPLSVRIHEHPSKIGNDENLRRKALERYYGLKPDDDEGNTWELISKFPKPTVIGLDRTLYTEESPNQIYFDKTLSKMLTQTVNQNSSPLARVKVLVNREYRKRKNAVLKLTNGLKNSLILSTFDGSITEESLSFTVTPNLDLRQIEDAESRIHEYFLKFEKQSFSSKERNSITRYFSQLKKVVRKIKKSPEDKLVQAIYALNAAQFKKLKKLLVKFEEFEKSTINEMSSIQNFLDTLNSFLKDSAKMLVFKEDTAELTFNILDKDKKVIVEHKDISYLSSGEQQLLILFSYIAFNNKDGKIFIIDEPELSLHIKWQEDFLEKLSEVTPSSTQLIIATHSPILVNKSKDKARLLLPYNN